MAGHRVQAERVIVARPTDVWTVLTDIERLPQIISSLDWVERTEGTGFERGVRWREQRSLHGRVEVGDVAVVFADAPRRAVIQTVVPGRRYGLEFTVIDYGDRVRLCVEFRAQVVDGGPWRSAWLSLKGALTAAPTRRLLERDLAEFAAAAEARARR